MRNGRLRRFSTKTIMTCGLMCVLAHCGARGEQDGSVVTTMDDDMLKAATAAGVDTSDRQKADAGVWQVKVPVGSENTLAHVAHDTLGRCGGFMVEDAADAVGRKGTPGLLDLDLSGASQRDPDAALLRPDQSLLIGSLIPMIQEANLVNTIKELSAFHNRHHKSATGVESQELLLRRWAALMERRADVTIEKIKHKGFEQPSIMLTVPGRKFPDEIIVLGGHGDSIATAIFGAAKAAAPGADDNASGIAVLTEVIRILAAADLRPDRTLKFFSYAGEEGGLLGSNEIAKAFKNEAKNVAAVLQLDMTNFNKKTGTPTLAIIEDFTSAPLNNFVRGIIDQYVKLPHVADRCGYACSDHASWARAGFATVMPHEAPKSANNKKIHTKSDTLAQSNGRASLAAEFTKIALAFAVELGLDAP